MSRQPISFRLNNFEFEVLESNRLENESLNQTAARLLREKLGVNKDSSNQLETITITQLVDFRIDKAFEEVYSYVDERVDKLLVRVGHLETKSKTTRKPSTRKSQEPESL